jgi:hypothetical protein
VQQSRASERPFLQPKPDRLQAGCDLLLLRIGFQRAVCDATSEDFWQSFTHAVL